MLNDDIILLIKQGAEDQQSLLTKLSELGHNLTQSSLSRKLKQLGIIKLHGKYQITQPSFNPGSKITFVPPNLLIISCLPGHANVLAAKLDNELVSSPKYPEFVGSIAGDDTIFLAVNLNGCSVDEAIKLVKNLI